MRRPGTGSKPHALGALTGLSSMQADLAPDGLSASERTAGPRTGTPHGKPKTDPGGRSRGAHAGEEGHRRYITPGQDLRRSRRSSIAWTPTTPDTAAVAMEIYRRSTDRKSAPSVQAGPTPRPRLSASTPPTSQTPTGLGQRIASPSARRRDNFQLGISVRLINARFAAVRMAPSAGLRPCTGPGFVTRSPVGGS